MTIRKVKYTSLAQEYFGADVLDRFEITVKDDTYIISTCIDYNDDLQPGLKFKNVTIPKMIFKTFINAELIQDLKCIMGLDLDEELDNFLHRELTDEINSYNKKEFELNNFPTLDSLPSVFYVNVGYDREVKTCANNSNSNVINFKTTLRDYNQQLKTEINEELINAFKVITKDGDPISALFAYIKDEIYKEIRDYVGVTV